MTVPSPPHAQDSVTQAWQEGSSRPGPEPWAAGPALPPPLHPTVIGIGETFGRTWTIFRAAWRPCLLAVFIVGFLSFLAAQMFEQIALVSLHRAGRGPTALAVIAVAWLATALFNVWLQCGQCMFMVKLARGQPVDLGELFRGGRYVPSVFVAGLIYGMALLAGLAFCIVPGIVVGLMFSQFVYLIVDRQLGPLEALAVSMDITSGNKLTLLLIYLIMTFSTALALVPCMLGLLVWLPYVSLMMGVMYLGMSGEFLQRGEPQHRHVPAGPAGR